MNRQPSSLLSSKRQSKTSLNLPHGLAVQFKRACFDLSDGAPHSIHMQDMVAGFMKSIVKSVQLGRVVPDPETLSTIEWTPSRVIPFVPAPPAQANDYVRMLTEILDAGGPRAEAIKMLLKALTSEEKAVRRGRKPA